MKNRLRNHSIGELRVFAQAFFALAAARLALPWVPLAGIRRGVWKALGARQVLPPEKCLPMSRVLRCANAAARFTPIKPTCLVTALVVQAVLHRHGYVARLRIGVRRENAGDFGAHAWLEYKETIVVGGPAEVIGQYQVLPEWEHLIA